MRSRPHASRIAQSALDHQFAFTEDAHAAALRDHDANNPKVLRHGGSGEMATAKTERDLNTRGGRGKVPTRGRDGAIVGNDKRTIQVCELLGSAAKPRVRDVGSPRDMSLQRIENERA